MKISSSVVVLAGVVFLSVSTVAAQGVNDAQIASIVVTANQVDIDAGRLAASRSMNEEVKTFANLMVTDHTAVNKSATDLAGKLKVTPQDNATSKSLKADGEKNIAHLKTLTGAAFDKAYIDREVAYHQQVIDALDKTLIPGAANAELKALLVKVRPAFVAHLEHAKRLQASIGKAHTVTIEAIQFHPPRLTVAPGDTIVWVNKDVVAHTATSATGRFDSHLIQPDGAWTFIAGRTGEYPYVCLYHPTMKAMLDVR